MENKEKAIVKRNFEAVIFDFDGTLAKLNIDFPLMRESLLRLIASYGVPVHGYEHLFALEMIEAGRNWIKSHGANSADYDHRTMSLIRDIEMEGAMKGELVVGVRDMLAGLASCGVRRGVVTRNCREAVLEVFPDIDTFCQAVITRESTIRVKPDPEHLHVALQCLGADPHSSAMVGDHPMDIEVGKKLGTFTIGVLTGYYDSDGLLKVGADLVLESAAELLTYIA